MKFCHVTLTVKNLDASLEFYQNIVGLPINRRFPSGEGELVFLGSEVTQVELVSRGTEFYEEGKPLGNGISIGFETDSTENMKALLKDKGYEAFGEFKSPRVSFFFVKDPDGYNVQFIQH